MNAIVFYRELGERLRAQRERLHMTQEELAISVGLTRVSITNIESGKQKPLPHTLFQIAEHLAVPVSDLFPAQQSASSDPLVPLLRNRSDAEQDFIRQAFSRILPED